METNTCDVNQTATLERHNQLNFTKRHQNVFPKIWYLFFVFQNPSGAISPPLPLRIALWENGVHQQHAVCFEYTLFSSFSSVNTLQ